MMIVKTSCNILHSSYTVDALSKAFRMRKCINKISCQQHYDNFKQNHESSLLPFTPAHPVDADTIRPITRSGQILPAEYLPSKNPSYSFSSSVGESNPGLVYSSGHGTDQCSEDQDCCDNQNTKQHIFLHKTYLFLFC